MTMSVKESSKHGAVDFLGGSQITEFHILEVVLVKSIDHLYLDMSPVIETIDLSEKNKNAATNENAFTDLYEATADVLRKKIQEIRHDVLGYLNHCINDMMSDVLQKITISLVKNGEFLYRTNKYRDKRLSSKKDALSNKEFIERNSLLTDLFKISHIRTVYNLFMMSFILFLLNTIACDIIEFGTIRVGTNTLRNGFAKFTSCIFIWLFMQASTLGVYAAFILWAYRRFRFLPKSSIRKLWDYSWLAIFILYQILFIIFSLKAMLSMNLFICCRMIIIMEQIRMVMKSYAFVRSAAPRFLSYKPHSETPPPSRPKFSQYLYFLFAPTLVYRNEYPRTKRVRWMVVIRNFIEFGLSIFYLTFILENQVMPIYRVFGTQYLDWRWFVKNTIKLNIPGIISLMTINYLLLHTWMNAWAEMLQFADRMFYKDWWNSTTYHVFFRTWNVIVHDWLYMYIYKDLYEIVLSHRMLSATAVFFTSAVVHEYILAFAFGFFYPVVFTLFSTVGFPMFFVRKTSNLLMWITLSLGTGIIFSLLTIEVYARQNCPPHPDYFLDLFIPRSWSCQEKFNV
ncbi:PREDICTED: sterol O-acyltransferase 1-like [Cyphomyrmex costatus]|uniref:sterol O-acyltransferase 1-like n=1 Tax=Cyphomyrmex costatus TaxID=456900 RepID=UPI00085231D8|nr:PREDICTED: sterol O-acyltransferase 1-like [Cyphomyrmex costatus]